MTVSLRRRLRAWREVLLATILVAAAALQVWLVLDRQVSPGIARFVRLQDRPAWERSAVGLNGEEFAAYIGFLRRQIPEDGKVILPPRLPVQAVAHVGLMQYYLFPREIHNCGIHEVVACVERVTGPTTYLLAVGDFPPRELASKDRDYMPFNEDRGVYLPAR
jgi:hypothetical protein